MKETSVFDLEHTRHISELRKEFLERLLQDLFADFDLKTAVDAGCGVGFFSNYLSELGLHVTAFDARQQNVAEAKRRYPKVEFCVRNVEASRIQRLGQFDLTLCFGLLYHLENPFQGIRNLYAITRRILIIESMVTPSESPVATLMNECRGEDQGLHHIAFVPSEACLIKMLYHAGFPKVYKTVELPNHEDYRGTFSHIETTDGSGWVESRTSVFFTGMDSRTTAAETRFVEKGGGAMCCLVRWRITIKNAG